MTNFSKDEVLASSKGWIASILNLLPGLGSGYIYQRRWLAYFTTLGAVIIWFFIGRILQNGEEPTQIEQLISISGIFLISIFTVIEANITYQRSISKIIINKVVEKKSPQKE